MIAIFLSFVVWYSSATLSTVASSAALANTGLRQCLWVDVTCVFLLAGCVPVLFSCAASRHVRERLIHALASADLKQAAFFHLVGTLATCASFATASASLTQVVKASEPVFTVVLSRLLGRAVPLNGRQCLSIALISVGLFIATYAGAGTSVAGVLTSCLSALCFPLRNISSARVRSDRVSPSEKYAAASVLSFFPALALVVMRHVSMTLSGIDTHAAPPTDPDGLIAIGDSLASTAITGPLVAAVLTAAVSHVCYNTASYIVLDAAGPVSHSIANIFKRFSTIIWAHAVFGEPFSPAEWGGLVIAASGFSLYARTFVLIRRVALPSRNVVVPTSDAGHASIAEG